MTDPIFEGKISTLAYGGRGILRNKENRVVFIPFTAPGDQILYRLMRLKKPTLLES